MPILGIGRRSRDDGPWEASTRRSDSGTTYRAYVNADVLAPGYPTRRQARRAAKAEAGRLNRAHRNGQ